MTTRYRVEYALKTHRRDQFIEWIKALLAVPFVLKSQPTAAYDEGDQVESLQAMAKLARGRYAEIMRDVEGLVLDHMRQQSSQYVVSKLKMLVPSIGSFFTPLHLEAAFLYQDERRAISSRRFVAPSFNDVRLILNTAQMMALVRPSTGLPGATLITATADNHSRPESTGSADSRKPTSTPFKHLQLLTFDGDVTLYDDGASLTSDNPVIPRLLQLLSRDIRIGIVTAAGYTDASRYQQRLSGLLDAIKTSKTLTTQQQHNLIIMGGESNFLFVFDATSPTCLRYIHRRDWILPAMRSWDTDSIHRLLDVAQAAFTNCIHTLRLPAEILRKERAVGLVPKGVQRITREQLEETVLVVQQHLLDMTNQKKKREKEDRAGHGEHNNNTDEDDDLTKIPFCAFNGGSDVFVDIGDKSLGVAVCQKWFGDGDSCDRPSPPANDGADHSVKPETTLHIGDQFLSGGGNDFKARLASTTAWIASPAETVALLDELLDGWQ